MLVNEIIVTTSWDDGDPSDVRLAELLQKYNVPATFYIPIDNVERQCLKPQEIREIADIFDVGGHTYHHVNLTQITLREVEKEIVDGKEELEELIGKKIVVVTNLEPVTLRGVESQGMLLAATYESEIVLLVPDKDIVPGAAIS